MGDTGTARIGIGLLVAAMATMPTAAMTRDRGVAVEAGILSVASALVGAVLLARIVLAKRRRVG